MAVIFLSSKLAKSCAKIFIFDKTMADISSGFRKPLFVLTKI